MDFKQCRSFVKEKWQGEVVEKLKEYVAIPNISPNYDLEWATNGLTEKAMDLLADWVRSQELKDANVTLLQRDGCTPLLFVDVPSSNPAGDDETGVVLLYGHMDKQPPFEGWEEGLDPYNATVKDGKLYGRGAADDGYAIFCAVTSIKALQDQGCAHARCVIVLEASEESGSPDLMPYINDLANSGQIGTPNLIICLDSGAGNYEQLWVTSSLRGVVAGELKVDIITEGVHSGDAAGVVPDTFRIARSLMDRVEDSKTGLVLLPELQPQMSNKRKTQVKDAAKVVGMAGMIDVFPFVEGATSMSDDVQELALNRWWRPQLTVVGAAGLPAAATAGNVLRPSTSLQVSVRLPPTVDPVAADKALFDAFTRDPPYGAKVTYTSAAVGPGWASPELAPWLDHGVQTASNEFFSKPAMLFGEGGSIPFMGMLGEMFPSAQFLVTGVIGPQANAHGPNEFLHLGFSENLTCCISSVIAHHCESKVEMFLLSEAATAKTAEVAVVSSPTNDTFCKTCNEPMTTEGGCVSPTCGGVVKTPSRRVSKTKRVSSKVTATATVGAPVEAYNNIGKREKAGGKDCAIM